MKHKVITIFILFLFYYPCSAQIITHEWYDFDKTYLPPPSNLIENYKKYEIKPNVDSLKKYYVMGDRIIYYKHFLRKIKYIRHEGLLKKKRAVRKDGEFTIIINMGPLNILSDTIISKVGYVNIHTLGYVKDVFYSLPLSVSIVDNDHNILFEHTTRDNSDTLFYRFTNNNEDKVFLNSTYLNKFYDSNFWQMISAGYSQNTKDRIIKVIERYFYENKLDLSIIFYTIKETPRHFNYSQLDSAYSLFQKGFNLFRVYPDVKSKYLNEFNKSLAIHLDSYRSDHPKITFDIKNALAYNIAVLNYLLGNYEEAEKYRKIHNNKTGIFRTTRDHLNYLAKNLRYLSKIQN